MNWRGLIGDNLLLKGLSAVLGVTAWLAVQGERTYKSAVETPVEYVLPPELVLVTDAPPPDRVVLVASGTRAGLNKLRKASIRYVVDLESVGPGSVVHSFRAPPDGLPTEVSIATVSPAEIELTFDERMTDNFPVELRTRGELPTGFVQTEVTITPDRVRLTGAKGELSNLEQVRTLPFVLNDRKEDFEGEVALDLSKLHVLPDTARSVRLTYRVQEAIGTRSLGEVEVSVLSTLAGTTVEPTSATVEVEGPVPVLDAIARRGLDLQLVGALDEDGWGADGTRTVGWSTEAPETAAAIRVQVLHPRAAEVKVLGLDPKRFVVRRAPQKAGDPGTEAPGATPGETPGEE